MISSYLWRSMAKDEKIESILNCNIDDLKQRLFDRESKLSKGDDPIKSMTLVMDDYLKYQQEQLQSLEVNCKESTTVNKCKYILTNRETGIDILSMMTTTKAVLDVDGMGLRKDNNDIASLNTAKYISPLTSQELNQCDTDEKNLVTKALRMEREDFIALAEEKRRERTSLEDYAARIIQTLYRRYSLLKNWTKIYRELSNRNNIREGIKKSLLDQKTAWTVSQSYFCEEQSEKRQNSARTIQLVYRRHLSLRCMKKRKQILKYHKIRKSTIKIQCFFRASMARQFVLVQKLRQAYLENFFAARTIQKVYRGYICRKIYFIRRFILRRVAAIIIQSFYRCRLARKRRFNRVEEKFQEDMEAGAELIQRTWRRKMGRVNFIKIMKNKELLKQLTSVNKIQRSYRRCAAYKVTQAMKIILHFDRKLIATIRIQCIARMYLARCFVNSIRIHAMNDIFYHLRLCNKERFQDLFEGLTTGEKINPETVNHNGDTVLMMASKLGYMDFVIKSCDYGVPLNYKNNEGETAIIMAIKYKHIKCTDFLLSKEDLEIPTIGRTLIHEVSRFGMHKALVNLVIMKVNTYLEIDTYQRTVFHEACIGGYVSIVKYLVRQSTEAINFQDFEGRTALHMSVIHTDLTGLGELLIGEGVSTDTVDIYGKTALVYAALEQKDITRYLSEKTQIKKLQDIDWKSDILLINNLIDEGDFVSLKILLDCGLDPNLTDQRNNHESLLMKAVKYGQNKIFSLLIERGADKSIKDNFGLSFLHKIDWNKTFDVKQIPIEDFLIQDNEGRSPFQIFCGVGKCLNVFDSLSEEEIIRKDNNGRSAIHYASVALHQNEEILYYIANKVVEADISFFIDNEGSTPLHIAACKSFRGGPKFVKTVEDFFPFINMVDCHGLTPLAKAAEASNINMLRALIDEVTEDDIVNAAFQSVKSGTEGCLKDLLVVTRKRSEEIEGEEEPRIYFENVVNSQQRKKVFIDDDEREFCYMNLIGFSIYLKRRNIMELIIADNDFSINDPCDEDGNNILHYIARYGSVKDLKTIFEFRQDDDDDDDEDEEKSIKLNERLDMKLLEAQDDHMHTPLLHCLKKRKFDMVDLLISYGAEAESGLVHGTYSWLLNINSRQMKAKQILKEKQRLQERERQRQERDSKRAQHRSRRT